MHGRALHCIMGGPRLTRGGNEAKIIRDRLCAPLLLHFMRWLWLQILTYLRINTVNFKSFWQNIGEEERSLLFRKKIQLALNIWCGRHLTFEYLTKFWVQTKLTNLGTIVAMACEIANFGKSKKYRNCPLHCLVTWVTPYFTNDGLSQGSLFFSLQKSGYF